MKCLAAIFLSFSASLFAQNAGIQTASITWHSKSGLISNSKDPQRPELGAMLADLYRLTSSTKSDILSLHVEKWKSGLLKRASRKQAASQLAASLESNLTEAMPALIYEVQGSSGSMSATFKLYNDLSAVVESVGALSEMAAAYGKKENSRIVHNDYAALGEIRQDLASYIQVTADLLEPLDKTPRPTALPAYGTVLSAAKRTPTRISER